MNTNINTAGLILAIICFIIVALQVSLHKWIKKVTNYYFFWAPIALFVLIWVMIFVFVPDIQKYIGLKQGGTLDPTLLEHCHIISNTFLLGCCPASTVIMSVLLLLDPSRKAARSFAPIALLGGIMIIFIQMPTFSEAQLTARFIFLGTEKNPCYFFYHTFNLLISVGVMLNTPKYEWRGYCVSLGCYVTYYSYVAIMAAITKCQFYVSGLNVNDWIGMGQYHVITDALHISPEAAMALGIIGLPIIASGIIALNDYVFKKSIWKYGNRYSKCWYHWYDYHTYTILKFI